jgi:hypothetical protein
MVLFAFAVVAVDVARLTLAANEVQSVADIAATAAATAAWEDAPDAVGEAQDVVALNTVNGSTASIDASDVILGHYDDETGTFVAGATPTNAARANAMATVNNILAAILGTPSTTVVKTSTAVVAMVESGTPTLPLAIGECQLEGLCPTCLPTLTETPNPDNSTAWTGFFAGSAPADITHFMPSSCGGGGANVPELTVGDTILLNSSQLAEALEAVRCQVDAGDREFVIPVVEQDSDDDDSGDDGSNDHGSGDSESGDGESGDDDSGSGDGDDDSGSDDGDVDTSGDEDSHSEGGVGSECGGELPGSGRVVGFITVHIDSVVVGATSGNGITMHGIFNAGVPGTPGGDCESCGTGHAVIVN